MRESARYAKIVAWSDEDQCYIGYAPGLSLVLCHGEMKGSFCELCEIGEEFNRILITRTADPCPQDRVWRRFGETVAKYDSEGAPA